MANNRKESPLKNIVKESLQELRDGNGEFPQDERLGNGHGESERLTGPERFSRNQRNKDEIIIDSLFADVADKSGIFIKISKEVLGRPGDWMIMDVIDQDWRKWADIDSEVMEFVRRRTRISPFAAKKWGTGLYRVETASKGGLRGNQSIRKDVFVNADEETIEQQVGGGSYGLGNGTNHMNGERIDPQVILQDRIGEMSTMIKTVGDLIPKPIALDPNIQQQQMAAAFREGMALQSNEKNSNATMMSTMMTGFMGVITALISGQNNRKEAPDASELMERTLGMMKNMGVIGTPHLPQKSVVDFLAELKAIGLNPFEKEDPLQQVNKLKQLAELALKFTGMADNGEKPGWIEKLVEAIGPAVPMILNHMQQPAQIPAQPPMQIPIQQTRNEEVSNGISQGNSQGNSQKNNNGVNPTVEQTNMDQVKMFFNQLYEQVKKNNRQFYSVILTVLNGDAGGQETIQGIINGSVIDAQIIPMLQMQGGERFKDSEFVMKYLVPYVKGFVLWVREEAKKQQLASSGSVDVICNVCHTEYEFESLAHWTEELNKNCEMKGCMGVLELVPMEKAG